MAGPPVEIRRAALVSCRRLLPRMHLAGYSSNILHPLLRVLDGNVDELRTDALDTICSLALALGPDFPIFAPTVRKVCAEALSLSLLLKHAKYAPQIYTKPFVLSRSCVCKQRSIFLFEGS